MKPEYLKKIFEPELERAVALLKETDPRSEDYGRLLFAIGELNYRLASPFSEDFTDDFPEVKPSEPDPEPDPVAPTVTEEPAPEPAPEPTAEYIDPESFRAELRVAKNKGVDISELIKSFGVNNYTALMGDQNKLRQLKAKMEKALKEIA